MKEANELMVDSDTTDEIIRNIHSGWRELCQENLEYLDASRPALDEETIQIDSAHITQFLELKWNIETHPGNTKGRQISHEFVVWWVIQVINS